MPIFKLSDEQHHLETARGRSNMRQSARVDVRRPLDGVDVPSKGNRRSILASMKIHPVIVISVLLAATLLRPSEAIEWL
jgi:hypothetical protein